MTDLPAIAEDIIVITPDAETARLIAEVGEQAGLIPGAVLVTVSLWRPGHRDLVRVHSNLPGIYRLGGVSRELGDDWVRQCVLDQVSFVADEDGLGTDAFEHHDVLAALRLESALTAPVTAGGVFLGCLNILGPPGIFADRDRSIELADRLAAGLAAPLSRLSGGR